MMNREYRITAAEYRYIVNELGGDDLSHFLFEQARLRSVQLLVAILALCFLGCGWSIERKLVSLFPWN